MHLDPNLVALTGIALWLGGSIAFVGIAREWSEERLTRRDRRMGPSG